MTLTDSKATRKRRSKLNDSFFSMVNMQMIPSVFFFCVCVKKNKVQSCWKLSLWASARELLICFTVTSLTCSLDEFGSRHGGTIMSKYSEWCLTRCFRLISSIKMKNGGKRTMSAYANVLATIVALRAGKALSYGSFLSFLYEPHRNKTNKMACAASEDRSAWVTAQSDQSLRCPHEETLGP